MLECKLVYIVTYVLVDIDSIGGCCRLEVMT